MIKNEWIKLFRNRVFLVFFAAVFVFYGFYLYWSLILYQPVGLVRQAPASCYQELTQELSALTDEEKEALLLERRGQMEELEGSIVRFSSVQFDMTLLVYEEVWDEVNRAVHYQEIRAAVLTNIERQERRLDKGNYEPMERRFLENRMRKTKEAYGRLADVAPVSAHARGVRALVDNPVTDFCCLAILLFAVFQLLTVERQNELIVLSKTTVRGRYVHGLVKAAVSGGVCVLAALLLLLEGILIVGRIYPLPSFSVPVQSVYSYCTLKISLGGFFGLYLLWKILFYGLCATLFYLVCCLLRKVIPILLVILGGGGLLTVLYTAIPETSYLAPLRTFHPIALGQAGELLERYQCVNLFGAAVNRLFLAAILLGAGIILFLAAAVWIYAVSGEKNILTNRRSIYDKKKRWSVSLTAQECYKAFVSQKLILVLLIAAVVSVPYVRTTNTGSRNTMEDHFYFVYSYYITGAYTEEIPAYIRRNQEELTANASRPDMQAGEQAGYIAMQAALSRVSEYAAYLSERENSYYIDNPAYTRLTGGNADQNRENIMTAMLTDAFAIVCFVLTMSIDYQRGENRLIHSTRKGRWHYARAKIVVGMLISLALLLLFWVQLMYRMLGGYGVDYIFAPAYSLPHLSWVWGGISIAVYLGMVCAARYLRLLVLMAFSYLVERKVKSSITAIVCVCAVVEIPLAVMLLA
ncbi:MAG: hypothetical protein NC254_05615 [bacterium]|nr:hypothetical protein [bacterium]